MGALVLNYESDDKYTEICEYLNTNNAFWIRNDIWEGRDKAFGESGIYINDRAITRIIADFTTFKQNTLKNEMKYFVLKQLREGDLTAYGCSANYLRAIRNLGEAVSGYSGISFVDVNPDEIIMNDVNTSDT